MDDDAQGSSGVILQPRVGASTPVAHRVTKKGNWQHGLTPDRLPPELEVLQADIQRFVRDCLADEGDESAIPARRLALLEYRGRVHRRILQIDSALELRGITDSAGRLRMSWIDKLVTLIQVADRLDRTLGLQRKAKKVPTLTEVLEE